MSHLICATCNAATLKPPRLVGGAWYALCTECLYETEVEAVAGGTVMTAQQEADLRRPQPAQTT